MWRAPSNPKLRRFLRLEGHNFACAFRKVENGCRKRNDEDNAPKARESIELRPFHRQKAPVMQFRKAKQVQWLRFHNPSRTLSVFNNLQKLAPLRSPASRRDAHIVTHIPRTPPASSEVDLEAKLC